MQINHLIGDKSMKTTKILALSLFLTLACSCAAFADGNAFTPLNFDNANYNSTTVRTSATNTASTPANVKSSNTPTTVQEVIGNDNMQSAILKLDNAQVDVRNELLNVKAKYSDIDAQYNQIKAERKSLAKQVKTTEKRIRQIEKAKEKIRKNML